MNDSEYAEKKLHTNLGSHVLFKVGMLYRTNYCRFFPEQLVPVFSEASSFGHQETEALGGSGAHVARIYVRFHFAC
jgi:hypothetical protein